MSDKFSMLMDISNLQYGYVSKLVTMHSEDATSKRDMDMCIDNYFTGIISTRRVTVFCDHVVGLSYSWYYFYTICYRRLAYCVIIVTPCLPALSRP